MFYEQGIFEEGTDIIEQNISVKMPYIKTGETPIHDKSMNVDIKNKEHNKFETPFRTIDETNKPLIS